MAARFLDRFTSFAMTGWGLGGMGAGMVGGVGGGVVRGRQPAVYVMASGRNGTLYVGVTSDLVRRAWAHRTGAVPGFTARYGCVLLVWFELAGSMEGAIRREKQIKGGSRARKLALIEAGNPEWRDLYLEIV